MTTIEPDHFHVGDWMRTYSGRHFWPLCPHPEDVALEDIMHHLANMCRFQGASPFFYNVADHSRLVAYLAMQAGESLSVRQACLVHDFAEAYVGDQIRPIKRYLLASYSQPVPEVRTPLRTEMPFRLVEDKVFNAIIIALGMPWLGEPQFVRRVHHYDDLALAIEARVFGWDTSDWAPLPQPERTHHILHIEHIADSEAALWRACQDLGIVNAAHELTSVETAR